MKRALLLSIVAGLISMSAFAQSRSVDVTGWVTWVDPSGDNTVENVDGIRDLDVDFETERGYGLGINVFWSDRISTEFAAFVVEPNLDLRFRDDTVPIGRVGSLEMIPITATLQYHLSPEGRFDPYIGAGVAWVLFDRVDTTSDIGEIDLDSIDFDDDFGFVVNGGISIGLTQLLAINLDVKYVPVTSAARAVVAGVGADEVDVDINPLIVSGGLSLQF
ncbi:MAG TPA: OmpW family outer membrane protein [Thermoanaerobaculia bacterium]|nr:OmpW family outer membrane protein [Thermoanaerobaculia bacterium]